MIYIYGDGEVAMTTGIGRIPGLDESVPFIAFAPTDKIIDTVKAQESAEDNQASVAEVIGAFDTHGVVMFMNSPEAMRSLIFWMARIMTQIMGHDEWIEDDERETVH